MKAHEVCRDSLKRLLLSAALFLCTLARAGVQVQVTTVGELPQWSEADSLVAQIPGLPLRPPRKDWEKTLTRAAEKSFEPILGVKPGQLIGIETVRNDFGDVLIAHWSPGQTAHSGLLGLWLWDTDQYNWFVLKCHPAGFESPEVAAASLNGLLKWQFGVGSLPVQIKYAAGSSPTHIFSGSATPPHVDRGAAFRISGFRRGGDVFIVLMVGKFCFSPIYPVGGAYVPERFPPLTEIVNTWSKDELLSQVGKMWSRSRPFANNNDRDQILITAAARKGFTRADLEYLLLNLQPPTVVAWQLHVSAVMRSLADTHQLDSNRQAIEDITLRLGRREETLAALNPIFHILRTSSTEDYSGLALKCLVTSTYADPPLWYLEERGNTQDVYDSLKAISLAERSRPEQQSALKQIAARIQGAAR